MKKKNFFATEFGQQTLAGILILLSFPTICCGLQLSLEFLTYLGMAFILVGMGIAPVAMLVKLFSGKK